MIFTQVFSSLIFSMKISRKKKYQQQGIRNFLQNLRREIICKNFLHLILQIEFVEISLFLLRSKLIFKTNL